MSKNIVVMFCSQLNFHALTFLYPALTISSRVGRKLKAKSLRLVLFLYLSHWWKGRFPLDLPWNRAIVANPQEESSELASTSGCHAPWLSSTWCGWCWRVEGQWTIPWKRLECQCDPESHGLFFLYFESVKVGNPGKRRHLWCVFFPAAPGMKSGGAWFEWIDRETAGGLTLYHVYVDVNGKVLPATTQIWPSHRSGTVGKLLARCKICWLHLVGSTRLPCGCWHGKSTRRWARRRPWWRGCPFWTPASINCLLFLLLFPAAKKLCGLSLCLCIYVTFFPW